MEAFCETPMGTWSLKMQKVSVGERNGIRKHAVITGPARMGGWGAALQPVVILGVQAKVTHIQTQLSCSGSSVVKNPSANAGDTRDAGSIPGSGRSPGEGNGRFPRKGNGNPL